MLHMCVRPANAASHLFASLGGIICACISAASSSRIFIYDHAHELAVLPFGKQKQEYLCGMLSVDCNFVTVARIFARVANKLGNISDSARHLSSYLAMCLPLQSTVNNFKLVVGR